MENVQDQQVATPTPKPNGGLSWKGIIEVFYQPAAFFVKLKDNPKVLVPYLIYGLITFVAFWAIKDLMAKAILEMPEVAERMQLQGEMTPEMRNMMASWQVIQWTLVYLLCPLAAAGLAYFWGSFIFGGSAKYKQLLSLMLYGELIFAASHVVLVPLMLAKGDLYLTFSLGALASEKSFGNTLYAVLSKFDLFIVWEIIVIGIGLSIIYGFPRNKGYLLSVLSMGLLTILAIISAIVSGMFR